MRETDYLVCPVCGSPLVRNEHSFICSAINGTKRHCFDISASGYTDLSYRNGGSGDPKDAVRDRTLFLDRGYYAPLSDEINRLCKARLPSAPMIIDAGCGEGYYSERLISEFPEGYLFGGDLSKHAIHRASVRRNMRGGNNSFYAVASVFALPVIDACADCVVSMFAPVAEQETLRVLRDGGILIVGAAAVNHLYGLKSAIYDEVHLNDERADLPSSMTLIDKTNISYRIEMTEHEDIIRLFGMTPYKFRTSERSFELLNALDRLDVEVSVDFYVYQK